MGKVIWSPTAEQDVDLIAQYIGRDSIERASLFVLKLIVQTERLADHPRSGRIILEINEKTCREIIYSSYRIKYRILENDDVRINATIIWSS